MPQWFSGVLIGVVVAWTTQWLQTFFKRSQYRHEKLMDRYSEFVASAVTDLERAKSQASAMALGSSDGEYTELAKQLDDKRHTHRLEMLRLSLQIRLLEQDAQLGQQVEELAKSQPFMAFPFPPLWGQGNYDDRFTTFKHESASFEQRLQELTKSAVNKHGARGLAPWV